MGIQVVAVQDGFSAGELSRSMNGQFNNQRYARGASWIQNFITTAQGPAFFRSGSLRLIQTRGGAEAFLVPFRFSELEAYILEFTTQKMRVHTSQGVVYSTSKVIDNDVAAVVVGTETLIKSTAHGLANNTSIHLQGLIGDLAYLNGPTFRVSDTAANTFKIKDEYGNYIDTTGLTFTSDYPGERINVILEVSTPYLAYNDLGKIKHAQTGGSMFLAHDGYRPQKLTRVSSSNWTMANHATTGVTFSSMGDYPAAVVLHEQRLLYAGSINSPQTVWGSEAGDFDEFTVGTNDIDPFQYTVVSEYANAVQWMLSTEKFLVLGTAGGCRKFYGASEEEPITPTSVNARTLDRIGSASVSPLSKDKRLIFVQQGRQRVRALEFEQAIEGYEPLDLNVLSEDINRDGVVQMASQDGFPDVLWCVKDDGTMSACTINFREEIYGWHRHITDGLYKSVASIPRFTGGDLLFTVVERTFNGENVHFLEVQPDPIEFPLIEEHYTGDEAEDIEAWSDAMFETQKRYVHLDQASTYDGSTLGMVENAEITLAALSGNDVIATSSVGIFAADDVGREIWGYGRGMAVIITYTSSTVVHVKITSAFKALVQAPGAWYLTADTISGLFDYEGETLQVITDGGEHQDVTVENGSVTLEYQASVVHVGRSYVGILKTMNIEAGGMNGPGQSRLKNICRMAIRVRNSLGFKYGTGFYRTTKIQSRQANSIGVRPTLPLNDDQMVNIADMNTRDKYVVIIQDTALPCTIQSVFPHMEVSAS